ncbi:retrotransposon protein, putative, ty1-copia subclass [Tanacetum coccineum]|uniref:Retrotransposon protein, putative, ty1-copia subclass n=1 Tax=Tanacetum coccineum TaxID=301880 RepID=A0ABQ4WXV6_9ASTR
MMLLTMDLDIQQNLAYLGANDMLIELKALYSKQAEQELLQTVREFHTCKQEEGQFVSSYFLKMKSYIDQLKHLGHPITLNLRVSLILVGLSKEYDGFVQNYNMHNMGKTVNELHAMLNLHKETLPKKVVAPALHAIRAGKGKMENANVAPSYAPKPKNPPPPKKENPVKDVICHHCGEVGHWRRNCPIYLTELLKKKQISQGASTLGFARKSSKEHGIITHRTPPYTPQHNEVSKRRNQTLLDMVRSMMNQTTLLKSFWDYALESAIRILNMVPTKKVEKKPYEIWYGQSLKLSYLKVWGYEALVKHDTLTKPNRLEPRSFKYQEASGSLKDLEIIREEDTNPSLDTSLNHEEDDQEIDEPQSDINPIYRSSRMRRTLDRMCLYIDAEEHELGDLGEPVNYKAALLDPKSEKWLAAINVEMQSMKDNDIWELVELPPKAKIVGHKWLFKKKTDMEGTVHTFKSRLIAKGFTQTYRVAMKKPFLLLQT